MVEDVQIMGNSFGYFAYLHIKKSGEAEMKTLQNGGKDDF